MSAPNTMLAKPDRLAALSRFFYSPDAGGVAHDLDGVDPHSFNCEFYEKYSEYIKYPLSLIASLEVDAAADLPKAFITLGFDTSRQGADILGWQVSVTEFARGLTSSTHGLRIFSQQTSASKMVGRQERIDAQGRSQSSLLLANGNQIVSPSALGQTIAGLLELADIDTQVERLETSRARARGEILQYKRAAKDNKVVANKLKLSQANFDASNFPQLSTKRTVENLL